MRLARVAQREATGFYPRVSLATTLCAAHAQAQVAVDSAAAQQPPERQRMLQAASAHKAVRSGRCDRPRNGPGFGDARLGLAESAAAAAGAAYERRPAAKARPAQQQGSRRKQKKRLEERALLSPGQRTKARPAIHAPPQGLRSTHRKEIVERARFTLREA